MTTVLSQRERNRATLARQQLIQRAESPVAEVVEHLVGLQAQTPHSWYVGLWSRVANFQPEDAADLLVDRSLVRIAVMRSTIHLVTASDARGLRALVQPVLDRDLFANGTHGRPIRDVDVAALAAAGRELLAETSMTAREVGDQLHEQWPDVPPATIAYALRNLLPLVQVPPRGLWGRSGPIAHTTAAAWLGPDARPEQTLQQLVRRYLGAFGPATVVDVQRWSGLTRLREIIDPLRAQFETFRGEAGQELFDLPDAPRPSAETSAPPRFLYDFDNLLLSFAERSRVLTDDVARFSQRPHGPVPSLVLIDGFTGADWNITREGDTATLIVRPYRALADTVSEELVQEGQRLLAFTDPAATDRRVEITPPAQRN